jgi:hypothetical protein
MPASASAGALGNLPIGVIGEIGDTRYSYEKLGAGAETLRDLAGRQWLVLQRCRMRRSR